jgi:hypothetical protein
MHYYKLNNIIERFVASYIAKKSNKSYHEVLYERHNKKRLNINCGVGSYQG